VKQPAAIPPERRVFLRVALGPAIEKVSKIGEMLYPDVTRWALLPDGVESGDEAC